MHQTRDPKIQTIRLIIVYTAMTLVVLVALTILLLFVQGYRFNSQDNLIEQGGLVQFESKPSGATITFDNRKLSRKTSTRLAATTGSHTVVMSRDGYRPWQKTITVEPGAVHWLDYAMLIPRKLEPTSLFDYQEIDQSLPAFEKNKLAILADSSKLRVDIIDTASAEPKRRIVSLPDQLVSFEDKTATSKINLISWDETANRIIAKVQTGNLTDWLVINSRDPSLSVNLSSLFPANRPLSQVMFDKRSSNHIYGLSGGFLYRIAYEEVTVPAPITSGLDEISQSADGVISFVTKLDKKTNKRSTGYYTPGAQKVKLIEDFIDDGQLKLAVRIGQYFGEQYLVTKRANTVEIDQVSLHPSDDKRDLMPVNLAKINLEDGIEYLDFSPSERFVTAQHKASYTNYDLEYNSVDTATVRGDSPVKSQLAWLDDFHIWSTRDNLLRLYEFDGENSSQIAETTDGRAPLLTTSGKYLYYVGPKTNNIQSLMRVQLLP